MITDALAADTLACAGFIAAIAECKVFIFVTLHVGFGTFQPIREETIEEHSMHRESYHVSEPAAEKIREAKKDKRRIIAVGTT